MDFLYSRRSVLGLGGTAGLSALAGCLDGFSDETPDRTIHSDHAISNTLSGTTAQWPVPRQNPQSTAALPGTVVKPTMPTWARSQREVDYALAIESTLVCALSYREFTAYNIETGEERWASNRGGPTGELLGIIDDELFILEPDSPKEFTAVDPMTGTVTRTLPVDIAYQDFYTATDDTLLVAVGSGEVGTLNIGSGERVYSVDFSFDNWVPSETNVIEGVAVGDEQVYVSVSRCEDNPSCMGGTLHALDLSTGALNWEISSNDGNVRAPTVGDDAVYVTDSVGVHARSPTDGHELWSVTDECVADGAVALQDWLFVGGSDLVAIDTEGAVQWRYTESDGVQTHPTVVGDHILVADDDVVHCLSKTTGTVEWEYRLSESESFGPKGILSNGTRTVVYGNGGLVVF